MSAPSAVGVFQRPPAVKMDLRFVCLIIPWHPFGGAFEQC